MAQIKHVTLASGALEAVKPVVVETIANLRALPEAFPVVDVLGHTAVEDGGGGRFLLLGVSADPNDIDSAGDDDNGFHIVGTTTGYIWQRQSDLITPQMFGAFPLSTVALAAASATNVAAQFQRAVNFWANPGSFAGMSFSSSPTLSYKFCAPSGYYRCESTIVLDPPDSGGNYQDYHVPGEFMMHGSVFTPYDDDVAGIRVTWYRTFQKPKLTLSAYKGLNPSGRLQWDHGTYPTRYLDSTAIRTWAVSTKYYRGEEIKHVISNVTYVYLCTATGTSDSSTGPTDTTGTEFTNGTAKFKCAGTCRLAPTGSATVGRSMNDIMADNRDIGVWLDESWEHDGITCNVANYCVGIAIYPRSSTHAAVGWTTVSSPRIQGCMVGVLVASYLGERMMAAGGRLTVCGLPVGAMVWETTYPASLSDVGTKYRFNGPVGGEATSGNWSVDSAWASIEGGAVCWANDCTLNLHLVAPYWLGAGTITGSKSQYGVVFTSFGPAYGINNNRVTGLALENNSFAKSVLNESTQVLFYTGASNQIHCRNENPSKTATALVSQKTYLSEQPRLNRITTSFAGKTVGADTYRLSRLGGFANLLTDAPFDEGTTAEKTVLFSESLSFSGYNTVCARDLTFLWRTETTALDYRDEAVHRYKTDTNGPMYNASDDTWDFSSYYLPCLMVDLIHDDMNGAIIRLDGFLSPDLTLSTSDRFFNWMAYAVEVDGLTKINPTKWTGPPVRPLQFQGSYTLPNCDATRHWIYPASTTTIPTTLLFGAAPGVSRVLLGVYGEHIRGFRLQVIGAGSTAIYSPYHELKGRGSIFQDMRLVDSPPEKGFVTAPAYFRYKSGAASPIEARFTKADGQKYYCTSGLTSDLTPGNNYQWGHDGAGQGAATIKEWDGTTWQNIPGATNAYYAVPSDFEIDTAEAYASIYVVDGSTPQSFSQSTWTKSTAFTTNHLSKNCTADSANDRLAVTVAGQYEVQCQISYAGTSSNSSNMQWRVYSGSSPAASYIKCTQKLDVDDVVSSSMAGTLDLAAGAYVELWMVSDNTSPSVVVKDAQLSIYKIN